MNMISCTQLDSVGISTLVEDGECIFVDRDNRRLPLGYASRRRSDDLFVIQGVVVQPQYKSFSMSMEKSGEENAQGLELWHRRLGHVSKERVKQLTSGIVEGIDMNDKPQRIDCRPCVEAKQSKSPATGRLAKGDVHHVVHSDIIGPIEPRTIGGARYIIVFMVEASRYAKVYVVKKRNEVFSCFKEFQAWIERKTDVLVKRFHSDNAKEYEALRPYLKEEGIEQSFSTAYTPQSNGLAERYNRTLLDRIRSMIQAASLDMNFWGEAALHAAYLTNVTGGKANEGRTPFEVIYGVKPSLEKIRVFGCEAYIHEPKEKRHWKLSTRGKPGILLGHENGMYRVWDLDRKEIRVSKHVIVDESIFPGAQLQGSKDEESSESEVSISLNEAGTLPTDEKSSRNTVEAYEESSGTEVQGDGASSERRYPRRTRVAPDRYVASTARRGVHNEDMPTLRMAMESDDAENWKVAIQSELNSLQKTGTWSFVDKPKNAKAILCKWVLKKKRKADGEVSRYKARLVICGNLDNAPIAHTFAPVVDFTVVRLVLAVAAQRKWLVHQVDYSNAFLQGRLDRKVYMTVPTMLDNVPSGKVCLLQKSLYGLREAPRIWYELLSKDLKAIGLEPMPSAPCVFRGNGVLVLCYVDDLLVMAENEARLKSLKRKLAEKLPANDMGLATDFLGMKLIHGNGHITLLQSKYSEALVKNMELVECRGAIVPCDPSVDMSTPSEEAADKGFPYRSVIGSLLYIATHTRPDIAVAASMLARIVEKPSMKHQKAAIKVVKYLKAAPKLGLKLSAGKGDQLSAYVDANWAGEPGAKRRSRTGIVIFYGEAAVYYTTVLQKGVTLSSTEAEYVALSESSKVIVWLRRVLEELGIAQETTTVFEDNAGTFKWASAHIAEDFRRSKHVDLRYHHVREQVREKTIKLVKVPTSGMVADFLTKPLSSFGIRKALERVQVIRHDGEEAY